MFRQEPLRTSLLALIFCLALVSECSAQTRPQGEANEPVAFVAGQPIYEKDLMSVAGPSLLDLHKQEYKTKSDALNQLIRGELIEVEAKRNDSA